MYLGVEKDFLAAKKGHPAFRVSDLNELADLLLKYNYQVVWDKNLENEARFYSEDNFGNRLEFMHLKQYSSDGSAKMPYN